MDLTEVEDVKKRWQEYSLELCIQVGVIFLFSIAFSFSSFLSYL